MVGFMDLGEQVDADFARARRRAFVGWVAARLRGVCEGLCCFDEARRDSSAGGGLYRGRTVVKVVRIVGSVGRHREFDHRFMPTRTSAARWKRVALAFHRVCDLPPVCLFRIGEDYFVYDGNHRVSVARYHGVETIEAEVTELVVNRAARA